MSRTVRAGNHGPLGAIAARRRAEHQRASDGTLPWRSARLMLPGTESRLTPGLGRRHRGVGALGWARRAAAPAEDREPYSG
jgi:hypothetical protein